jgi:hypothetical protein
MIQHRVESFISSGRTLVVINFINQNPAFVGNTYQGYDFTKKVQLVQNYLRSNFTQRSIEGIDDYNFFVMQPAHPMDEGRINSPR